MNIGIDIDGVILDFERTMRYYAELYDLKLHHQGKIKDEFNYMNNYNWTEEESRYFKEKYLIKGTTECSLVPGAKESLDILHERGYKIIIISARGSINLKTAELVTKKLNELNVYYDEIHLGITNKVSACITNKIDIMIDDNPTICKELKNNKIKTIYLKDNKENIRNSKFLITVTNWAEILRVLLKNS